MLSSSHTALLLGRIPPGILSSQRLVWLNDSCVRHPFEVLRATRGYDEKGPTKVIANKTDFETFFAQAPRLNPNVSKITGVICGYRVEEIEDPLMQQIRYLDKLVDELAKGKAMEKILRK